ncbi:MAG: hypothetical protein ABIK09_11530 [Pseudomonadota bacterium]
MGARVDGWPVRGGGVVGVFGVAGIVFGQVLLFLVTLVMVLYFSPGVQGLQAPLLAMALDDRPVRLVFAGGVASPLHGRVGIARPVLLDEDDREILKAELIEINGAGWRGGGPAVASVLLKSPEVNVFITPDGSLSLMVLLKEKKRRKRKKEKGSWTVESLRVEDGWITVDLPLVTGHVGPLQLSGHVGEVKGVSRGALDLRIEGIALEVRGPSTVVALLDALGWTPERLSSLGPVEVRASWDGNRFAIEEASFGARPLELSLEAAADLDALSVDTTVVGTWEGEELLQLAVDLSPKAVRSTVRLDLPDVAALPTLEGVTLQGFGAGPATLEAGGREVVLKIGEITLGTAQHGDLRLGELSLGGQLTLRLAEEDLAAAWAALWGDASAAELLLRFKPVLNLILDTRVGAISQGELALTPDLRVHLDAGFTPPMTLDLRTVLVESGFGQMRLRGRLGPKPPLGLPGYEGTLQLVGIDLAAIKENVKVSPVAERFLSGRLEGEVVFEGSPMAPERLTLARCSFGIVGGEVPLGIHCPEGGTVIDPTRAPEVGPMTLFKKEIPWGEGKLLLGAPTAEATP